MVDVTAPFDLFDLFVNELFGDIYLFLFIGVIIVLFWALSNKMGFEPAIMISALFLLLMGFNIPLLRVLIILVIGVFFYFMMARGLRRG